MLRDSGEGRGDGFVLGCGGAEGYGDAGAAGREGIVPALERAAHAVAEAIRLAPTMAKTDLLMVNLSGRGDKDMGILAKELELKGA